MTTVFHDLPEDAFPLTIEYVDLDTGKRLLLQHVPGPGVIEVAGYEPKRVAVRITFADGTSQIGFPEVT